MERRGPRCISEVTLDTVNLLKSTLPKTIALDVQIEPGLH
jgi:hypothetical protein